jgi:hypothetical protein
MTVILGLLSGFIEAISSFVGYLDRKQLIDVGQSKAIRAGLKRSLDAISKGQKIRRRRATAADDLDEL